MYAEVIAMQRSNGWTLLKHGITTFMLQAALFTISSHTFVRRMSARSQLTPFQKVRNLFYIKTDPESITNCFYTLSVQWGKNVFYAVFVLRLPFGRWSPHVIAVCLHLLFVLFTKNKFTHSSYQATGLCGSELSDAVCLLFTQRVRFARLQTLGHPGGFTITSHTSVDALAVKWPPRADHASRGVPWFSTPMWIWLWM